MNSQLCLFAHTSRNLSFQLALLKVNGGNMQTSHTGREVVNKTMTVYRQNTI